MEARFGMKFNARSSLTAILQLVLIRMEKITIEEESEKGLAFVIFDLYDERVLRVANREHS